MRTILGDVLVERRRAVVDAVLVAPIEMVRVRLELEEVVVRVLLVRVVPTPHNSHRLLDVPREDLTLAALGPRGGKKGGDGPAHDSLAACKLLKLEPMRSQVHC